MAKKKKAKKIGLFDLIMMLAALVGLVLAIVGICIPFFARTTDTAVGGGTVNMGLFDNYEGVQLAMKGNLTIGLVQAFAIISLILTALAAVLVVLGKLGVLRFKGLLKLLFAVLVIAVAALVITFAATYAAQSVIDVDVGSVVSTEFIPAAGAYLVMAGGIVTGVSLLLSRLK